MATRVIPTEVKVIKPTDLTDPVVQIWIDAANTILTAAIGCIGSDEALLTQIELFLSAHFIELLEPGSGSRIKREKTEDLEIEYAIKEVADEISETVYGRAANKLSRGCLKNLDKASIALISVGHKYVK